MEGRGRSMRKRSCDGNFGVLCMCVGGGKGRMGRACVAIRGIEEV